MRLCRATEITCPEIRLTLSPGTDSRTLHCAGSVPPTTPRGTAVSVPRCITFGLSCRARLIPARRNRWLAAIRSTPPAGLRRRYRRPAIGRASGALSMRRLPPRVRRGGRRGGHASYGRSPLITAHGLVIVPGLRESLRPPTEMPGDRRNPEITNARSLTWHLLCSPDRIRTGVTALRGRRPRPLDDGAVLILLCWSYCADRAGWRSQRGTDYRLATGQANRRVRRQSSRHERARTYITSALSR